jgi:serine/threonine protein kinase
VGTEGYRAPEVESGSYEGLKADLFAIGVILFILVKGTPPFMSTKSHDRIYRLIRERRYTQFWQLHEKGREPDFFSDSFKRLINSFISAEPDRRPTFDSLEEDDWMGGNTLTQEQLIAEMTARAAKLGKTFSKRTTAFTSAVIKDLCNKEGYRS